jgi:hypothetical protein
MKAVHSLAKRFAAFAVRGLGGGGRGVKQGTNSARGFR